MTSHGESNQYGRIEHQCLGTNALIVHLKIFVAKVLKEVTQ